MRNARACAPCLGWRRTLVERQHSVPLLLPSSSGGAEPLKLVAQQGGGDAVSEAYIQALVHEHPACLPIAEIDAMFSGRVPICTELNTPAGPIDNFMVTPSGLPVLVECKLWRNPVVTQFDGQHA
jgi:hypothetical protein